MIHLITGQPGAGKTLYTIDQLRKVTDRPIYYSGIPGLALPWTELPNPEKWHECPTGSIVVIDEAQRIFRPRGTGQKVPEHVEKLETHRHSGIDLWIITQHPMLIDSNLRRLVGLHRHVMRAFGAKLANVHEWQEVNQAPDRSRKDSIVRSWAYPTDVYTLYKSAEVHTHKMRLPVRLLALAAVPVVLAISGYLVYQWQHSQTPQKAQEAIKQDAHGGQPPKIEKMPSGVTRQAALPTPDTYVPRVPGVPETAPRYDELTKPIRAPLLSGCVMSKRDCRCYTPDGSRYYTTPAICTSVAMAGVPFNDWRPDDRREQAAGRIAAGAAPAAASPQPDTAQIPIRVSRQEAPREAGEIVQSPVAPPLPNLNGMTYQTAFALAKMQRLADGQ